MECRAGLRLLKARRFLAGSLIAAVAWLAWTSAPRAGAFTTRDQALAETFPGARIEPKSYVLTDAQLRGVREAARVRVESKLLTAYAAWRGDTLAGVAFLDSRTVRTMPGVFMTVVAPDTTVERVEVLAFHEPPDYRPTPRWLERFGRRRLDDRLWPRRDIRNLSGATLSTRAVTESVRLALADYREVVAPDLARARALPRSSAGRPEPR